MRNIAVHYKNKYPGAVVEYSDDRLDVYSGEYHLVALRKNGAGQWVDKSEEIGCMERHDLSPIPKDARVFKEVDGKISLDEKADERRSLREKFLSNGKILSCEELSKKGFQFDEKQRLLVAPSKAASVEQA